MTASKFILGVVLLMSYHLPRLKVFHLPLLSNFPLLIPDDPLHPTLFKFKL